MATVQSETIQQYIASFPEETRRKLQQVYSLIKNLVPEGEEKISYGIPTFRLNNTYLVYFAGYKHHLSLYPIPRANEELVAKMSPYKSGKGTLQFQLSEEIPLQLITEVVHALLRDNKGRIQKEVKSKVNSSSKK